MTPSTSTMFETSSHSKAAPILSVLIPYLRDNPCRLIAALGEEAHTLEGQVELVLLDDGGGDAALNRTVQDALTETATPARLIVLDENIGRAKGRNLLAQAAAGEWLLFIDSDMLPDSPAFLRVYLDLIAKARPALVYGGFSLRRAPTRSEYALHRHMAAASDCLTAEVRRRQPEKHVFTSNLLVRRDVFAAHPFDAQFTGWGWEDVEWAMRAATTHDILHIDNTATHLGLNTAPTIAAKYEQSVANFSRVVANHARTISTYPSYRAARRLKSLPLLSLWRPLLKRLALADPAPVAARALAMRLYRAALYADAV